MIFRINHHLARDEAPVMTLWLGVPGGTAGASVWCDDVRLERLASPAP